MVRIYTIVRIYPIDHLGGSIHPTQTASSLRRKTERREGRHSISGLLLLSWHPSDQADGKSRPHGKAQKEKCGTDN